MLKAFHTHFDNIAPMRYGTNTKINLKYGTNTKINLKYWTNTKINLTYWTNTKVNLKYWTNTKINLQHGINTKINLCKKINFFMLRGLKKNNTFISNTRQRFDSNNFWYQKKLKQNLT